MPFVRISVDDSTIPPPPSVPWFFYNSASQIDDPAFTLPSPGGPTTAAGALTSEAFGSLSNNPNRPSLAGPPVAAAAAAAAAAATATSSPSATANAAAATSDNNSQALTPEPKPEQKNFSSWEEAKDSAAKILKELEEEEETHHNATTATDQEVPPVSPPPKKKCSITLDPPVYASVSFSGALVPTSAAWSAFNPNNNLELETAYQNYHKEKGDTSKEQEPLHKHDCDGAHEEDEDFEESDEENEVLVGIRRLFCVNVKKEIMKPVYWKPIRDISHVMRSEWFFSSTLTPVEPSLEAAVAKAFFQVRPWTNEYVSELQTALQVPESASKIKIPITYTLTPEKAEQPAVTYNAFVVFAPCNAAQQNASPSSPIQPIDPLCKEEKAEETAEASAGTSESKTEPESKSEPEAKPKNTIECIPKEYPVAYIFGPQLGTSSMNPLSYLISPTNYQLVSSLLSGKTPTGILAILQRHFDWASWKKIRNLPDRGSDNLGFVPPAITDVIFVIHGIGQKLSERLESFNFTYAINRFNILIAEQLESPNVKQYIEENTNIIALPINWRKTLDFDAIKNESQDQDTGKVLFTLSQITLRSIPAIRNIISDVMLDIPYYMSHYKNLLIEATAGEANRIYRLLVKNNPGFEETGKVHIIGHSLGSVLALDILSYQPNKANKTAALSDPSSIPKSQFCFDTTNLFFAGSPVGFFLLLENSSLVPRKLYEEEVKKERMERYLRSKSTMELYNEKLILPDPINDSFDSNHQEEDIADQGPNSRKSIFRTPSLNASTLNLFPPKYPYGCMSIQRLYNVMHYSDPISYCLNPTVDPELAEDIEQAVLPTEKEFPLKKVKRGEKSSGKNGRAGSFFETWKVKLPELFSSSPTTSPRSKRSESLELTLSPNKEITTKSADIGTSSDDQAPLASSTTEESRSWSGRSFMSKILRKSESRGRSDSVSSISSVDSTKSVIVTSSHRGESEITTTTTISSSSRRMSRITSLNSESVTVSESESEAGETENISLRKSVLKPKRGPNGTILNASSAAGITRSSSSASLAKSKKREKMFGDLLAPPMQESGARSQSIPPEMYRNSKSSCGSNTFDSEGVDGDDEEDDDDDDESDDDEDDDTVQDNGSGNEKTPLSYAERKMAAINDNGQIDFIIPLVGTLENQYLSMLKAHGAYWDTKDFARLVAIECGRPSDRPALRQFKAKKKTKE